MADGTACVVDAGAQSAREPARILLHGLAHADSCVSSRVEPTIEHHARRSGQLLR
jgi:hypothetical protein